MAQHLHRLVRAQQQRFSEGVRGDCEAKWMLQAGEQGAVENKYRLDTGGHTSSWGRLYHFAYAGDKALNDSDNRHVNMFSR
jgi:hypothetical protein